MAQSPRLPEIDGAAAVCCEDCAARAGDSAIALGQRFRMASTAGEGGLWSNPLADLPASGPAPVTWSFGFVPNITASRDVTDGSVKQTGPPAGPSPTTPRASGSGSPQQRRADPGSNTHQQTTQRQTMNAVYSSPTAAPAWRLSLALLLAGAVQCTALADINIPSDGSDGSLVVDSDTVIDLGEAATGAWNVNNSANAGKGIYDPEKWAVVFKYSSVTVSQGATVTFKSHPSRAPVVWLVQGDATITGRVSLDGQGGQTPPKLAEPGPGAWLGGMGFFTSDLTGSAGFGPGGGRPAGRAGGGSHGTPGLGHGGDYGPLEPAPTYGNPSGLPLLGGSGGGGEYRL